MSLMNIKTLIEYGTKGNSMATFFLNVDELKNDISLRLKNTFRILGVCIDFFLLIFIRDI